VDAHLLTLGVQILLEVQMSVSSKCCVMSGRGLCDRPITCPKQLYRVWCVQRGDYTRLLYALFASEFSRQLVSMKGVLHLGLKRLGSQLVALYSII